MADQFVQDIQRTQQLVLQQANTRLRRGQIVAAQDEQELRWVMSVMDPKVDWVTPEQKAKAFNQSRLPQLFGFDAPITADALNPLHSLVSRAEGIMSRKIPGKINDLMPLFELFQANPQYFDRADQAKLLDLQGAVRDVQARTVVPEPPQIQASKQRLSTYGPILTEATTGRWADLYANFTTGAIARKLGVPGEAAAGLDAQYQDANEFVNVLRRDFATVEADTAEAQERERTRFFLRSNPAALTKALEGKVKEAGLSDNPTENFKIRALRIAQQPLEAQSPEDRAFVQAWAMTYATKEQAEQLGVMTSRQWAALAEQEIKDTQGRRVILSQITEAASQSQSVLAPLVELRERTVQASQRSGTQTVDEAAQLQADTTAYLAGFQQQQQAYEQQTAPMVEYLGGNIQQTTEQADAIRSRLATAPPGQRDGLARRLEESKLALDAHRAGMRLLKEHSPFDIEVLKSSRDGIALQLTAAEATGDTESLAALRHEHTTTDALIQEKEAGRAKDRAKVEAYRLHLLEREKTASLRLTSAEARMQKDEGVRLATQMVHTLHREGKNWTTAIKEAADQYSVPLKDVHEQNKFWIEDEGKTTLNTAQRELGVMAEAYQLQTGQPPDERAILKMTTTLMGDPRFKGLNREEIKQGLPKGKTIIGIELPRTVQAEAIKDVQNQELAQLTIDDLRDIVEKNPTAVGSVGGVKRFLAGTGQQVRDLARAAFAQDTNINPKAKQRLTSLLDTKPDDELEALTIGLTYRVARAVSGAGVLSDNDIAFAERLVGGLRGASGSQQFLNHLGVIEREMRRRSRSARGLLESKQGASGAGQKSLQDMSINELLQQLGQTGNE